MHWQNKRYKICSIFPFAISNSSLLYFNLQFLYKLKPVVHLSKSVFHFRFLLVFIKLSIFAQEKPWTLWLQNLIIYFKKKVKEKSHTVLLPVLWFISCNLKCGNWMTSMCVGAHQSWPRDKVFELRKSIKVLGTSLFLDNNF